MGDGTFTEGMRRFGCVAVCSEGGGGVEEGDEAIAKVSEVLLNEEEEEEEVSDEAGEDANADDDGMTIEEFIEGFG